MKSESYAEKAPHFEIHKGNSWYAMECEAVVHQFQASTDQGISTQEVQRW